MQLQIFNKALARLGGGRIQSLTELSRNKTLVDDHWTITRRSFLADHPWDGSVKTVALVEDVSSTVPSNYSHAFNLPDDFLSCWRMNDVTTDDLPQPVFDIFVTDDIVPMKVLLTDARAVSVFEYSSDLDTDAKLALLNPVAAGALAMKLAYDMATGFGKREQDLGSLKRDLIDALSDAKVVNGRQRGRKKFTRANPLVDARFQIRGW